MPDEPGARSDRRRTPAALERMWHGFVRIQCWLTGLILTSVVVVSLANVFMRYILTTSIVWADEVARLSFIVVSFIGAGLAVAYGAHLVIDTVVERTDAGRLPGRLWRWLIAAVSIAFFLVLIVGGLQQALRNFGQASPALQIPIGYVQLGIPVGGAIMLINYLGVLAFGRLSLPAEAEETQPAAVPSDGREVI